MDSDDELEREMAALESVKRERAGRAGRRGGEEELREQRKGVGGEPGRCDATRRAAGEGRMGWDGTGRRLRAGLSRREREGLTTTATEPRGAA